MCCAIRFFFFVSSQHIFRNLENKQEKITLSYIEGRTEITLSLMQLWEF